MQLLNGQYGFSTPIKSFSLVFTMPKKRLFHTNHGHFGNTGAFRHFGHSCISTDRIPLSLRTDTFDNKLNYNGQ